MVIEDQGLPKRHAACSQSSRRSFCNQGFRRQEAKDAPPYRAPISAQLLQPAFRRPGELSQGVGSLTHFNEGKISSRNKYIFNEPFSGRLNYFRSHTKYINPFPSVVVPYYKFKNILRSPSPTIPGKSLICSQKIRILHTDSPSPLNGNKHAQATGIRKTVGFPPLTQLAPSSGRCYRLSVPPEGTDAIIIFLSLTSA